MDKTAQKPLRLGPLLAAGLLVLTGLVSLGMQYCSATAGAAQHDWDAAAQAAIELAEPEDAIRVHPSWSEAALPALRPVGNLLHRQHEPLLEDLVGIDRVLILSESRRVDEALEHLPFRAEPREVHDFDTVQLLEVETPEELRLFRDARDWLLGATVAYESKEERELCRWHTTSGVWRCDGSRRGGMVGPILLEVEHEPRRCIQAFPPSGNRHLSVQMNVDKLSHILRIRAGLDQRAARLERGGDVRYRIFVDDRVVADEYVDGHTSRWKAHDVSTAESDVHAVELRIEVESVADEPHHRRFCFNVYPMTSEQARR